MPNILYNNGIDLNTNYIYNSGFEVTPTEPSSSNSFLGRIIFNSNLAKVGYWNGTKYVYDTELTYANIVAGLGYTPYDATNPDGFISGITSSDVTTALGYTPVSTALTINGYALTGNISLTASDVGALPDSTVIPTVNNATITIQKNSTTVQSFTLNQSSNETINITVPTQASDVGALPATTTINDLTSTAQQNALNSGITSALVTQIGTNQTNITTINNKIPAEATSTNKLADKAYVDNAVQTNSAHFRGNWTTWSAVPTDASDYPVDDDGNRTPTTNDYMVVQDASGYTGDTLVGAWQFAYTGTWATNGKSGWLPKFQINEEPLTPAQQAALDSGITSSLVTQIGTNQTNIGTLQTAITTKADAFAVTNPALTVSGGVCTWPITNSIGTKNVQVHYYRESDGVEVKVYTKVTTSTITASFNTTTDIAAGTYRAVVTGLKA